MNIGVFLRFSGTHFADYEAFASVVQFAKLHSEYAMSDRLAALLSHFSIHVSTFHAGAICGIHAAAHPDGLGQLHLLTEGTLEVRHGSSAALLLQEPTVLLYPRPMAHTFVTDERASATLVCADLAFDGGAANPVLAALPSFVAMPLSKVPDAGPIFALLSGEAAEDHCGRKVIMDSLCQVVVVQLLRELMEQRTIDGGMLAGLGHPMLAKAIVAMHNQPEIDWSLDTMAEKAGMSRTTFAETFKDTVGITPGAYLQTWRIGLAQKGIKAGRALKLVAIDVGYGSEGALSRAFRSQMGRSPREWRKEALQHASA